MSGERGIGRRAEDELKGEGELKMDDSDRR